ncbi:MAG: amidohydrolase family protein [Acidimicrobiales bacterium]
MAGWDVHTHLVPTTDDRAIPELGDPAALTRWLDEIGLDGAIVSPPPPALHVNLGPAESAVWSHDLNDGLAHMVASDQRRLRALAYLPISNPPAAADEFHRRTDNPWAGALIPTSTPGRTLADPELEPLWAALDAAHAFVFVHPIDIPDDRLERFYLRNLLGNPMETAFAAACLVFAGVPERHPAIRFCLAHAGGATPALAGRWQRGRDTKRPGVPETGVTPEQALRCLYADCLAHSPAGLRLAIEVFGSDHIVLGSDWPFPMGHRDPGCLLAALDPDTQMAIREVNPKRLASLERP